MLIDPSIFRDYDIRAIIPSQLDEEGVKRVAGAIVDYFKPKSAQIGRDMRVTSPKFHEISVNTFLDLGVNVVDLELTSTDMLYFASGTFDEDIAINVSASHNPPEFNGFKMVKKGAVAISGNSGIYEIRDIALSDKKIEPISTNKGVLSKRNFMNDYVEHVLSFVDLSKMKSFNVVVDTGNGMAGHFMPFFEKKLPWNVTRLFYNLDGTFPNHTPSPIELKNMQDVINKVKETNANVGMAFDGDGDRVFLVDEKGRYITGTLMTAMIAENLIIKNPGQTILYNAVVGRVVPEIIKNHGGIPMRVRVGHTLIKEDMRKYNGLFCGEHSGHYYFRDNFFADSAIIAALLVLELMSVKNKKLSEIVDEYNKYSALESEINFVVDDKEKIMKAIEEEYKEVAKSIDWLDGISIWFDDYWFNVRPSNTEPLLRLNIEADTGIILEKKVKELVNMIENLGGKEKI